MVFKRKRVSSGAVRRSKRRTGVSKVKKSPYKKSGRKSTSRRSKWINNDSGTSRSQTNLGSKSKMSVYTKMIKWIEPRQIRDVLVYGVSKSLDGQLPTPNFANGIQGAFVSRVVFDRNNIIALQREVLHSTTSNNPLVNAPMPDYRGQQTGFKIFLESCEHILVLTNNTTGNEVVDIYDCVMKKDHSNLIDPLQFWDDGQRVDEAKSTTGIFLTQVKRGYKRPFTVPTNSNLFNQYVKIVSHKRLDMSQGRNHEHVFKHTANRMIDMSQFGSNSVQQFAGLTSWILVVHRGQPAMVGGAADSNVTIPSIAKSSLVWVGRTKYTYRSGITNATMYAVENDLEPGYGGQTNTYIISEGAGDDGVIEIAE